jgi:hypothetical protein
MAEEDASEHSKGGMWFELSEDREWRSFDGNSSSHSLEMKPQSILLSVGWVLLILQVNRQPVKWTSFS